MTGPGAAGARPRAAGARGRWRWVVVALALALAPWAVAATVTIDAGDDPDARLELRKTLLPSGVEVELIVLTGREVRLTVDDLVIIGGRIELDVAGRLVRVIGPGSFESGEERVEGIDLELRLDEERLRAIDAIVFTSAIDVRGELAERLPGQLTFAEGLASPCSRCDQEVLDYAFRARRMILFPGDRLVGYDVDVLIRDVTVLRLPLLVLPLARGDRSPQFTIASGNLTRRAEVALRWPYVAGGGALGTFTVRYLAEVDPTDTGGVAGRLLGGAVEASAVGFELDHRVFDDVGTGVVRIAYEPARPGRAPGGTLPPRAPADARWTVRFAYQNDPPEGDIGVRAEAWRDDARTPGRWTYQLALTTQDPEVAFGVGVRARFDSQGFVDTDPDVDPRAAPAYADRATARRTPLRLRLEPLSVEPLQLGSLRVTSAALDLGFFEDLANPANRRAAALGTVSDARALLGHTLTLGPWTPWEGLRIEGDNRFEGRYYAAGERAVTWRSRLAATQALGQVATLSASLTREVEEGETPFRFDAAVARSRTEARFSVDLRPAAWVSLRSEGGYVIQENRRPETVGWAPLTTRLTLFADRPWIDASVEHRWPILEEDPGTLRVNLSLQARRSPADLRVAVEHLQDLRVADADPRVSETFTRVTWRAAADRVFALDVTGVYRPLPAPDAEGRVRTIDPLDLRLELGSMRTDDARPGARLAAPFDVELERFERLTVDLRARVGPVELDARERIDLPSGRVDEARLGVTWDGVARLDARGWIWLPPAWLGHEPEPRVRQLSVQVRELRPSGSGRWELGWRSTLDPSLGDGARRDTLFEVRVALLQDTFGPWLVGVEGLAEWALRDDRQPDTYLRRASLLFGADAWERVGLQGRLSYQAVYDPLRQELSRSELTITDLTLALRLSDAWLVGARMQDVWELTGSDAARSPWTFRPEVFFVWDRCCWALAGSWNAATGAVRVVLSGPGAERGGLEQVIDTPWALPRAPLAPPEEEP